MLSAADTSFSISCASQSTGWTLALMSSKVCILMMAQVKTMRRIVGTFGVSH